MDPIYHRLELTPRRSDLDTSGHKTANKLSELCGQEHVKVTTREVYSVFARISSQEAQHLIDEIGNPVIQLAAVGGTPTVDFDWIVTVGFQPGVTDNLAHTARTAIEDILGRELVNDEEVYSSIDYLIQAQGLSQDQIHAMANQTLANPLIQTIQCFSRTDWERDGIPVHRPRFDSDVATAINAVDIDTDDGSLVAMSKANDWALSVVELQAIRTYFRDPAVIARRKQAGVPEKPTDAELEVLAQTWSEHCKHKIFDAHIDYDDGDGNRTSITSLYKSFIKKSTFEIGEKVGWLVSVFADNAGVIAFNDDVDLVYKVETHNSPSALDPYGGAMTGIVGVNRDPAGTGIGAELLINVWGYCFGSPATDIEDVPEGLFHPARIRDGVHQGVIDGGNQSGVPYGFGWEYFDQRYIGKPLVFCGTVGTLPKKIHGRSGADKEIRPGDRIVMAGGRIGKDGIHGATFSSEALQQSSPAQAVQIGDPITQKCLTDFLIEARDKGLYRFITDNGAGGLSCSVGEMSIHCGGSYLDLTDAPLKYAGLQPWEILVSESQERMTLAVPPEHLAEFTRLAASRDVEVTNLGEFTDSGQFHVVYDGQTLAYIDLEFLFDGCPRMQLQAKWTPPSHDCPPSDDDQDPKIDALIPEMVSRLNICSNESKARQYDNEVKGLSVVKPFVGVNSDVASDATVFMISPMAKEGVILSAAVLPRYSDIDTYHMTASTIDLAVRRTIAVGGKIGDIAALDNFCWPDPVATDSNPDGEYKLAQLVRANQALYDYTKAYDVPCISGKDSMKNDSVKGGIRISVPPTLLFSTIAKIADVSTAVTLEAKAAGDLVYVLGTTKPELGGSEYYAMLGYVGNSVPKVHAPSARIVYETLSKAIDAGLCRSVHTPALGGLAVAFAKIAIAGDLGLDIDVTDIPTNGSMAIETLLFSETNSRFVVTIAEQVRKEFEAAVVGIPTACVGRVKEEPVLSILRGEREVCAIAISSLRSAYKETLKND